MRILISVIMGLFIVGGILAVPDFAQASPPECSKDAQNNGISFGSSIECYVSNLYNWSIGVGAALAVIVLMYAGYIMVTSSGDPQKIGFAKEIIVGSLSGLALLAGARLILNLLSTK